MWILRFGIGFLLSGFETIQFIIAASNIMRWPVFSEILQKVIKNASKETINQIITNFSTGIRSEQVWGGAIIMIGSIIVLITTFFLKIFVDRKENTLKPRYKKIHFMNIYIKLSVWMLFLVLFTLGFSTFFASLSNITGVPKNISILQHLKGIAVYIEGIFPYILIGFGGLNAFAYIILIFERVKGSILMIIFSLTLIISGAFSIISQNNVYSTSAPNTSATWSVNDFLPIISSIGCIVGIFFVGIVLYSYKSSVSKIFFGYSNINDVFILKITEINRIKAQAKSDLLKKSTLMLQARNKTKKILTKRSKNILVNNKSNKNENIANGPNKVENINVKNDKLKDSSKVLQNNDNKKNVLNNETPIKNIKDQKHDQNKIISNKSRKNNEEFNNIIQNTMKINMNNIDKNNKTTQDKDLSKKPSQSKEENKLNNNDKN